MRTLKKSDFTTKEGVLLLRYIISEADEIFFQKVDGSTRRLILGTPPADDSSSDNKDRKISDKAIAVYEKDKGWRSFRIENLLEITLGPGFTIYME